ncbi:MAG: F0F1 ATP synthase subunit A [Verrucomicrobia bacterium]|nr:F0F1 ATP synthase subunit A [Verrucomicrobiota bacterium]
MAAEHAIPTHAEPLFSIGPLAVTNSMVVTWVVTLAIVLVVQAGTRRIKLVPSGVQNVLEFVVESLYEMLEGIIGPHFVRRTLPFLATVFVFILACNWTGLIPGFGTIGWGGPTEHGFHVNTPLLRPTNADVNMTMAMAITFTVLWMGWYVQAQGFGGAIKHLFAPKGGMHGAILFVLVPIFIFVGLLELVSIFFVRPLGLTVRLFGNIYAGDSLLEAMGGVLHFPFNVLTLLPFYFMELLVGIVQALVFMLLCAAFTTAAIMHEEEGH